MLPPILLALSVVTSLLTERLWLSLGPADGGPHAWRVFDHGPALVCSCHCSVHLSREQLKVGIRMFSSRRAAQIPWHSRAKGHWAHDIYPDGLLSFFNQSA